MVLASRVFSATADRACFFSTYNMGDFFRGGGSCTNRDAQLFCVKYSACKTVSSVFIILHVISNVFTFRVYGDCFVKLVLLIVRARRITHSLPQTFVIIIVSNYCRARSSADIPYRCGTSVSPRGEACSVGVTYT